VKLEDGDGTVDLAFLFLPWSRKEEQISNPFYVLSTEPGKMGRVEPRRMRGMDILASFLTRYGEAEMRRWKRRNGMRKI